MAESTSNSRSEGLKRALVRLQEVRAILQAEDDALEVDKMQQEEKLAALKTTHDDPGDQEIGRSQLVHVLRQQTCQLSTSLNNVQLSNNHIAKSVEKELADLLEGNSHRKQRIKDFSIQLKEEEDTDQTQEVTPFGSDLMDNNGNSIQEEDDSDNEVKYSIANTSLSVD